MNALPAPILMLENVSVDFDGFKALTNVSPVSYTHLDDSGNVAPPRLETQTIHRGETTKTHGQISDAEDHIAHYVKTTFGLPSRTVGLRVEIKPRGRTTMITTSAIPKISMR